MALQIEVSHFALSNFDGQPPVAADRNAPSAGAIALKVMHPPPWRPARAFMSCRRDAPNALHELAAHLATVIVSNEAQQAPVPDAPNKRSSNRTVKPSACRTACSWPRLRATVE
jgi:hypothetical protein